MPLIDMGDSWRIGVDPSETTTLVRTGVFGWVRNPIFTAVARKAAVPEYAGAATIDVTCPAFTDGGAIPQKHAGKGVGENVSPALQWTGVLRTPSAWS
jgi:hypothetical protein